MENVVINYSFGDSSLNEKQNKTQDPLLSTCWEFEYDWFNGERIFYPNNLYFGIDFACFDRHFKLIYNYYQYFRRACTIFNLTLL